jgi:hypothetical protein
MHTEYGVETVDRRMLFRIAHLVRRRAMDDRRDATIAAEAGVRYAYALLNL